jgi:hypothetical protein
LETQDALMDHLHSRFDYERKEYLQTTRKLSEVAKRGRPRKEDTQRARLARQKAEWKKVKAELMNNKGKATESEKENMNVDMDEDE